MSSDSKLRSKIKSQIARFAAGLSEGFSKPKQRFLREALYGIRAQA